jgi:hypothetical protein
LGRGDVSLREEGLDPSKMFEEMSAAETARLTREALHKALAPEMQKAYTQSATATTGLTMYSLEAPAKLLYPVITP